jgi:NADH:ubiquinone oxidoreductase subunit 4 (subunit M)
MQTPNVPAQFVLIFLMIVVIVSGVYPAPLFDLTADTLQQLFIK